jgi:alkyldihydroxyacetonephosphate synthase
MELLTDVIGQPTPRPAVTEDAITLPESKLEAEGHSALAAAVGGEHVSTERQVRLVHAGGKSYSDLVRLRSGDGSRAPDAVVFPGSHEEVMAVLRACADRGIAVVTFGGGTSVVGGVDNERGANAAVISLDLRRLNRVVSVDEDSMTATLEPGLRGPQVEELLGEEGLTLGHFPQSFEHASVGGWVATRSAGQASTGFGRIDDRVLGLRLATPSGELRLSKNPSSAAGPDLIQLFVGSEGVYGVITEVTLRVFPKPKARQYEGWVFKEFADGVAAFLELAQRGLGPDISRLSDVDESTANLAMAGLEPRTKRVMDTYLRLRRTGPQPCMAIVGWEGTQAGVSARREAAAEALGRHGGVRLGRRVGDSWEAHRYGGPRFRDTMMGLGVLAETLETATSWSNLDNLYEAVRTAILDSLAAQGTPAYVMTHISHLYATGASLYFTVLARQVDGDEDALIEQWMTTKKAATQAIVAAGGTITHHHAVGQDHAAYLPDEVGPLGIKVLKAVKETLDPAGILNPGKLVP